MEKSIEIDCAPATPRPDTYLPQVIDGTGLEVKEPISKLFGNWKWDYSEVSDEKWEEIQPLLKERITSLCEKGYIRYGSW